MWRKFGRGFVNWSGICNSSNERIVSFNNDKGQEININHIILLLMTDDI